MIAFGRRGRERAEHGGDLGRRLRQQDIAQRVRGQGDADLAPLPAAEDEPVAGLGVEKLVRKDDGGRRDGERPAEGQRQCRGKGMRHPRQHALRPVAGFDADLDRGVAGRRARTEQAAAGLRDEFAEEGAERRRREEVGAGRPADAPAAARVVAGSRVVQRELHEPGERQDRAGAGGAVERPEELGGREVGRGHSAACLAAGR